MASVAALGFSIISRYSGGGVAQARRDLATLRAQMATLNDDMTRHTKVLDGIPKRWKSIGTAVAAITPALIPIGAAALQASGALLALAASVGAALGAYGAAMKGAISRTMEMAKAGKALSPVQKEFVGSVKGMKDAWNQFIKDTTGQTLSTATNVVKGLTSGIKLLKPLVDAVHPSVLQLSKDFANWMKGDSAKNYSNIIAGIAKTSMPLLAQAGRDTLNFLGDGFRAFAPLANDVAKAIANGAAALKGWSDGGGFQRFLEYVHSNSAGVKDFFKALGDALHNLFNIFSQFSGGALSVLTDALRGIAAINPGSIKAIAQGFLLMRSPIGFLILNCPPLRDAMIALIGAMDPATIYTIVGAFTALRIAWAIMNTTLLTTPLGWLVLGIMALVTAIVLIATKTTWFQTAWAATWNFIKTVASAVWTGLQVAWSATVNGLILAWQAVSGALVTAWNAVWQGMSIAVQAVWSALQIAWNAVVMGLSTAWTAVSGALVLAWNTVWSGLQIAAQAVWNALQIAWSAFTTALATAWTAVSGALVVAWNAVWSGLQIAAQAVWTALQIAWSAFTTALSVAWTTVSGALVAAWNAVWSGIQIAAQAVWNAMQVAWSAFVGALSTAWTAVSGALSAAWNAVWNAMSTAARAVWTALQAAWSAFITAMQTIWSAVSGALSAAWNAFWNAIKTAAQAVWTALQAAWNAFLNGVRTVYNTFSSALTSAWNAFWNAIKTTAQTIWNAIKAAWQAIVTGIRTIYNTFASALQAAWSAFWNAVKTAAQNIWNALKAAWQAFVNAVRSIYDAFSSALKSAWQAMWNAIKTAAQNVWNALKSAWSSFTGAIRSTYDKFASALKSAWSGLWNGLKDTAKKIWHTIGEVIESAINGVAGMINKIIHGIEGIADKVGLDLNIPDVPTVSINFANGGMVGGDPQFSAGGTVNFSRGGGTLGGFAPGRDTVPAVLSRGEGVLVPEAVRGLGGSKFVHWANSHFSNGRGGKRVSFNGTGMKPGANHGSMGAAKAYHRGKSGWGFATGGMVGGGLGETHAQGGGNLFANGGVLGLAIGGVPSEIPIPDPDGPNGPGTAGGTVGQKPHNTKDSGEGVLDVIKDTVGRVLTGNGLATMVLGFIGEAAMKTLFEPIFGMLEDNVPGGEFGKMLVGVAKKFVQGALEFFIKKDADAKEKYESMAVAGAQPVQAWIPVVEQALKMTGAPMSWLNGILSLMAAESGGNPNAINGWDVNAKNGVPSQGLMQVIPPTFSAYHQPGTSNNILDPLANIAAAINYIKARYGYVPGSPYALGTSGATSGVHLVGEQGPELVNFKGGETVTPAKATAGILGGGGGGLDIAGMVQGALTSGGTPDDMLAQFEQIVAAAQQMATSVQGSWTQVTGTATTAQAGLAPVVSDIVTKHSTEIPAAMAAMTAANTTAWTQMSTDATTQWAAQRDTTFAEAGLYMGTQMPTWGTEMNTGVSTAWSDMAAATSESWTSMEAGTSEPVNWIIDNSYNNGIAAMWNAVAGVIWEGGGKELPTVATLAKGGPVRGPGTGTSDSIPAMLSRGEHVLTAREVQKAGGHQAIYRMRDQIMGFANGGAVDGELKRGNLWAPIEGTMRAAVDSTKSQLGDLFGRTSGSASVVSPADWIEQYVKKDDEINKFVGGPPWVPGVSDQHVNYDGYTVNQRTADMLNAAKELGASFSLFQGSFNVGVAASAGTHDGGGVVDLGPATSSNVGFLRAVGFAAWGRGPEWGSPSFASHIHAVALGDPTVSPAAAAQQASFLAGGNGLADNGPDNFSGGIPAIAYKNVDPADINQNVVSYDKGGFLQPGYTMAYNGTGKPEPVGHDLVPRGSGEVHISMPITITGNTDADKVVEGINNDVLPKLRVLLQKGTGK